MNTAKQAMENMEYVRRLLKQKQPAFVASLELAVSLVERNCASPSLCRGMLTPLRPHDQPRRTAGPAD